MAEKHEIIQFLNPSENTVSKIKQLLLERGFMISDIGRNSFEYKKGEQIVEIQLKDSFGEYINIYCREIESLSVREALQNCLECGGNKIKPSLLMGCKKSELTDKLELEGKLDYGPGAYDRIGTFAPTKTCLNCGCKWHNTADLKYWSST